MNTGMAVDLGLVILGGVLQGSFALPMKRIQGWRWENIWLMYSITGMLVFPCALLCGTVPDFVGVFHRGAITTLAEVAMFGFGWGVGSILFGLGIARVGMALTFAIVLGLAAALGSLLPLAVLQPQQIFTRQGCFLLVGLAIVLVGIAFCTVAGRRRERELSAIRSVGSPQSRFLFGIAICILSGVLSSMLNFSFEFGKGLRQLALAAGANKTMAANPVWALALAAGFVPNAGYCVYLLHKHRSWSSFVQKKSASYWLATTVMGLVWFGGIAVYGFGAGALGTFGGVVGWPMFMAMIIVTANVLGAASGEWKGTSPVTNTYSWLGIAVLIFAIYVISRGSIA